MPIFEKPKNYLNGKKTYIISIALLIWAVAGWYFGWLEPIKAQETIWGALLIIGGRSAIRKLEK